MIAARTKDPDAELPAYSRDVAYQRLLQASLHSGQKEVSLEVSRLWMAIDRNATYLVVGLWLETARDEEVQQFVDSIQSLAGRLAALLTMTDVQLNRLGAPYF